MNRNYFSVRNEDFISKTEHKYKDYATISDQNVPENNYMKPLTAIDARKVFDLQTNMTNKETYNITKEKLFAKDKYPFMKNGQNLSNKEFITTKQRFKTEGDAVRDPNPESTLKKRSLNDNKLVFEMNNKAVIRKRGSRLPNIE